MAPRTAEQQKAYNEKRRAENAARKAEADASVKAIKQERKAKAAKPAPKVFAGKTKTAKPIKGVDDVATYKEYPRKVIKRKPIEKIASQPTPAPAQVDKSQLTNARSYQKKFAGMGATMRGSMAQVTVTFTVEQFNTLKSAAGFRGTSIAETIRQSVLKEHGSAIGITS